MKLSKWLVSTPSIIYMLTILLYLHISIRYVHSAKNCAPSLETPGWTVPRGDVVLKEGENLQIYCLLDPREAQLKNYSSSQIFFERNNERIPSINVTILNDTAVVLLLYNVSAMNDWLHCKLDVVDPVNNLPGSGSSIETSSSNETLICSNIVAVGRKPREIENFTCYSFDWKELNCTWIEPYNEVRTTYTISYQLPKRSGRNTNYQCPKVEDFDKIEDMDKDIKRKRCSWSSQTDPIYRNNFEYLTFIIFGNNTIGNHTQTMKFHNHAHIIPSAPKHFEALEKTVSSVQLRWFIDSLITFDKGWFYKISYTWNSSGTWNVTEYYHKDKILEKISDEIRLNVTGLKYPNTLYDFRVSMRSAVAPQNERWSEPASVIVKTKPCPPFRAPKTDRGSFEISSSESTDNYRIVHVYWQPIPRMEYNGDNFTYDISVFKDGVLSNDYQDAVQIYTLNSYAKYKINFNSYKFVIRSKNAEGLSENTSVVEVPCRDDVLNTPTILSKIDYGYGVYELSWKALEGATNVNYTVFWCETNREYPYQCDGFIDWEHVKGDVNKFNFTTKNYSVGQQSIGYQFAVSAVSENSSSGMTWASCTVLHDTVNKIKGVWIDKIDSYYMYIRWKLECSNRVDGVKGYYIYYCAVEPSDHNKCKKDSQKTIKIYGNLDTDQANITELEPFTYYQISMAMFTNNITGPRSEALINQTLDGPPDTTDIDFECTAVTNTSIALRWNSPKKTNGVLQRYLITFNNNSTEVPANETGTVLENLISYQQYQIKLQACTILCSHPVGPLTVTTKIGKPGNIDGLSTQNLNATHMVVEWSKLAKPGGPHPVFKIMLTYNDSNKVTEEEVTGNYTVLDKEVCNYGEPSIQVRGINKDDKGNSQVYEGDWSKKLALTCPYNQGSPVLRVMFAIAMLLIIASVSVTWGRKALSRCQEMKNVSVTLPGPLNVPPFKLDSKDCDFYEDFSLRTTKSIDEIRTLVDKTTELARDQDLVECESGTSPWVIPLIKESIF